MLQFYFREDLRHKIGRYELMLRAGTGSETDLSFFIKPATECYLGKLIHFSRELRIFPEFSNSENQDSKNTLSLRRCSLRSRGDRHGLILGPGSQKGQKRSAKADSEDHVGDHTPEDDKDQA